MKFFPKYLLIDFKYQHLWLHVESSSLSLGQLRAY